MNNKGIILSTYVYMLLIFFLLVLGTLLVVLNNTKILSKKINTKEEFSIVLLGNKEIELIVGDTFTDPGYIAQTIDGTQLTATVNSNLDSNTEGTYTITYTVKVGRETKTVTRTISVVSSTPIFTYITNLYNNETTRESNGLIQDDTDDTNIRYSGPDEVSHLSTDSTNYVKNYVYFNCSDYNNQTSTTCEKWRIIGIFNVSNGVTTEERVKIVRNASIGGYSWDSSASNVNSGYGYNVWETIDGQVKGDSTTKAALNTLLNDYYYNAKSGQTCYNWQNNESTTCDFSSIGLNATSRSMIEDAVWNIGGFSSSSRSAKTAYNAERGTTVYSPTIAKTEWKGIVGLIYPSDYGYATTDTGCRNNLYNSIYTCKNNNWLSNSSGYYTLSPCSSYSYIVFYVNTDGYVHNSYTHYGIGVRPSIYLKSNINIIDGDGSSDYPYQLNA